MQKKQYVPIRLPIIIATMIALVLLYTIMFHNDYHVYASDSDVHVKVALIGSNIETVTMKAYTKTSGSYEMVEYEPGTKIYAGGKGAYNELMYFLISSSDLKKCGIITGISVSKDDGSVLDAVYASNVSNGLDPASDPDRIWNYPGYLVLDEDNYTCIEIPFINGDAPSNSPYSAIYNGISVDPNMAQCDYDVCIFFNKAERTLLLDKKEIELEPDGVDTIQAITQSDYFGDAKIVYSSDDDSIASIDSTGKITAHTEGETNIKASISSGDKTDTQICKVIVSKASDPAVDAVVEKINAIGEVTLENEDAITEARNEFNFLTDEQKALIPKEVKATLENAEKELKVLKAAPVITLIDGIGDITEDNYAQKESDILDAQAAYNALNADIQPFVTNYAKLLEARIAVAEFKLESTKGDLAKVEADKKKAEQELQNLKDEIAAKALTVSGLKVTSKAKKFTVKWKKNSEADGYQVQYKLKSAKKYKTLKNTTALKVTSKKLKKGKKYQFRVRTYKKVNGIKTYGVWSNAKAIMCK